MNIKSRFCQNPKTTTLYNSQVGALVMICSVAYKLSSLPSIVNEYMASSTTWLFVLLTVVDTLSFVLVYAFFRDGGDEELTTNKAYKIGLIFLALFLGFKCVAFFSFAVLFFTVELYVGVPHVIVVLILIAPVVYLGTKGCSTLARTAEIFVFMVFFVVVLNLAFLEADLDVNRNLPVFSMEPKDFFAHSLRYGTWLGNCFPLLFVKIKNKKLPYVSSSYAVTQILTLIVVFFGVAMYGDSMKIIGNLLVEISGFNQLSTEIGRMEWTALFVVIVSGILELAFLFYGVAECSNRIFGCKLVLQIALPMTAVLSCTIPRSPQVVADLSHQRIVGGVMAVFSLILPIYFVILKWKNRRDYLSKFNYVLEKKEVTK